MKFSFARLLFAFVLALGLADNRAPAADLFDTNRVLKVQITMAPADWDRLRNQERDVKAEFSKARAEKPPAKPYTWFKADVVIDGTALTNVGVRKRGFIGSADKERPGLNLDFNRFEKGRRLAGHTELKLHNNKQDATNMRQILAYRTFAAAGVPAPRCSLAQVSVNGKDLGVFTSLEGIDDDFLKRHFGSSSGNLYEAQISDFRPGWTGTFEKKNNKDASRADLEAVSAALQSPDAQLLERLGRVVDIDAFISFWAVESLINHWDGFNGDLNNTFVYHDPKTDKLRFIPWGADATFGPHHVFIPFEPRASVWAVSHLARRLYNHPETQRKYRARMQQLLDTVWNEAALQSETERLEKLARGLSKVSLLQFAGEVTQLRQFIAARRDLVQAELKQPAVPWNHPSLRQPYFSVIGKVTASFDTAWVANVFLPAPAKAKAHITLEVHGRKHTADFTDVKAMPDILNSQNTALSLNGSFPGVEVPVSIWVSTPNGQFASGATLSATNRDNAIILVTGQVGKPDFRIFGMWDNGPVKLVQAGRTSGAKVAGTIEAELSYLAWEDLDLTKLKRAQ
jgi:spore coat protein CotH